MPKIDQSTLPKAISDKYALLNNALVQAVKTDWKDRISAEVGDTKDATTFQPQVKICRWDNEVNLSLRLLDGEQGKETLATEDDKIKWSKGNKTARFYEIAPNEEYPDGAFEFDIELKKKPKTNIIEFSLNTKGVDFFYQPALTQQEIDEGANRPENVVGSYAVYASEQKTNYVGGKEYKVGKVGHIYRPKIYDASGAECWGILSVDKEAGKLMVEIPQEFLDKAVYPVVVDPTFGYTTAKARIKTAGVSQKTTIRARIGTGAGKTITARARVKVETSKVLQMKARAKKTITIANWSVDGMNYSHQIAITIDHSKIDSDLTNFPILIHLTAANFDFSEANSDGFDLRFTLADGTILKYEREQHDAANEVADYWVKIPSVSSSTDTIIYLYYRSTDTADGADPENVWDSNHKAVLHLKDNTTSSVLDSTSNNNDGTKKGANEPVEAAGQIYKAQDFDGTDDYISLGSGASINITGALAIEAWVYIDSVTGEPSIIDIGSLKYGFTAYTSSGDIWFYIHDGGNSAHASCGTGAWHHVVGTWDGTTNANGMKLYIDGELVAQHTSSYDTTAVSGDTLQLGRRLSSDYFNGKIDEVLISNVARSAAWIKASYYSGANNLVTFAAATERYSALSARAKIKFEYSKKITSKARVKTTATKTMTERARIKNTASSIIKARAKISTFPEKKMSMRGRIKQLAITKTTTTRGRIKQAAITKATTTRGRIKQAALAKTITSRARVKGTLAKTMTMLARIYGVTATQSSVIKSKARIRRTGEVTTTIRARMKGTATQIIAIRSRMKSTQTSGITMRSRITARCNYKPKINVGTFQATGRAGNFVFGAGRSQEIITTPLGR